MKLEFEGFGRPLCNPVRIAGTEPALIEVDSSGVNETMPQPRVAILGLGIMGVGHGGPGARTLVLRLRVYNRNREKAERLGSAGASVAATSREAAAHANIIISMVADDAASRAVWLGDDGALAGAPRGAVLIESSTVSVPWVRELAAAAAERGCELLDAPVTGSKPHAASGELLFLVGGSASALSVARPVLAGDEPRHRASRAYRQRSAAEAHQQFSLRRSGCVACRSDSAD